MYEGDVAEGGKGWSSGHCAIPSREGGDTRYADGAAVALEQGMSDPRFGRFHPRHQRCCFGSNTGNVIMVSFVIDIHVSAGVGSSSWGK